jgi:hypothetical protein
LGAKINTIHLACQQNIFWSRQFNFLILLAYYIAIRQNCNAILAMYRE